MIRIEWLHTNARAAKTAHAVRIADLPDALLSNGAKVTIEHWGEPYDATCTFGNAAQALDGMKALQCTLHRSHLSRIRTVSINGLLANWTKCVLRSSALYNPSDIWGQRRSFIYAEFNRLIGFSIPFVRHNHFRVVGINPAI